MDFAPLVLAADIDVMHLVKIAVVGGLIGWVASLLMHTDAQMGLLMNIIVGIAGAALGHFLAGVLGIGAGGLVGEILIMLGGAVVLILVLKLLRVLR